MTTSATAAETWNPYSKDGEFWSTYLKGRPQVPESLFTRIRDYHAQNNGSGQLITVHDVGAGAGVHSARWAPYAQSIIVSDPSEENIRIAKAHLANTGDEMCSNSKYSFHIAKAEDDIPIPDGSVDIFFASVCIHFAGPRIDDAIAAAARQLRPGGTLFVGGYGLPYFFDEDVREAWLRLMYLLVTTLWESRSSESREYARAVTSLVADVNCVPAPEQYFRSGVKRIKMNFPREEKSFRKMQVAPSMEKEIPFPPPMGEKDEEIFEQDDGWHFKMDRNAVKAHFATMKVLADGPEVDRAWEKFERFLGDREVEGVWPAQLILATRI